MKGGVVWWSDEWRTTCRWASSEKAQYRTCDIAGARDCEQVGE